MRNACDDKKIYSDWSNSNNLSNPKNLTKEQKKQNCNETCINVKSKLESKVSTTN